MTTGKPSKAGFQYDASVKSILAFEHLCQAHVAHLASYSEPGLNKTQMKIHIVRLSPSCYINVATEYPSRGEDKEGDSGVDEQGRVW